MSKINLQEPQRNRNANANFVNLIRTSTVLHGAAYTARLYDGQGNTTYYVSQVHMCNRMLIDFIYLYVFICDNVFYYGLL